MSDPEDHIFIPPNWRSPVQVSVEFKTDVFSTHEGYETRSALREFPRFKVSYSALGGRRSDLGIRGRMASNQARPVGFPDFTTHVKAVAVSGSFLSGDFDSHEWASARGVYVVRNGVTFFAEISTPRVDSLTLDRVLDLQAGDQLKVYPEMVGRISKDFSSRYLTSRVHEAQVTFEAYATQDRVKELVGWSPSAWYREKPVALWAPNWANVIDESWSFPEVGVDPGYGIPWFGRKTEFPIRTGAHKVTLRNSGEVSEILSFFAYCRGRQASFYAPTWVDDFNFHSGLVEGQKIVRVLGQSALHLFEHHDVFKNIAIRKGDKFFFSAVTDAYASGQDSEIVLSQPVPADFEGVKTASWLLRQRFASDSLEVEYLTESVAEADVRTVSLIDDFMCLNIGGKEITTDNLFLTMGLGRDTPDFEATEIGGYHVSIGGDFIG